MHPTPMADLARLGPYARTVMAAPPDAGDVVMPAADLLDGATLEQAIRDHAAHLEADHTKAVGAAWAKHHGRALVPVVVAAMTVYRSGLDTTPGNIEFHLRHGAPRTVRIVAPERLVADDGDVVEKTMATLVDTHIGPLFDGIHAVTGTPRSVLWGSLGNLVAYVYDRLAETHPDVRHVARDRHRLLEAETAPWGTGPNPMRDPVRYETLDTPGLPPKVQVRRTCCLKLKLPGKPPCYTCPTLDHEARIRLMRELGVQR